MLPLLLAPIVQQLMSQGLGLLGNAVMAKGQAVIEDKLGVKLETTSPDKLLELQMKHEEFLLEASKVKAQQELDIMHEEMANTDSARKMNSSIQESANASTISKVAPYYLDFTIVGMTLVVISGLFFFDIPSGNKELAFTAVGSLLTMCNTILNFHRGTSSSNRVKDETIKGMLERGDGK